jgi:hypothetical protein
VRPKLQRSPLRFALQRPTGRRTDPRRASLASSIAAVRGRISGSLAVVLAGAAAFAAIYIALDFNALFALRTNQNTGLYLQSLVNFAHRGTTFDQSDGRPHLAVHEQWTALPLALLTALWPYPETLIVIQVLSLALAAPVLYRLTLELGAAPQVAAMIALAYLLAPSTQGWAYHGFVPEDALPTLAFAAAIAIGRRSLAGTLLAVALLLGIKEDETYFLIWVGGVLAWTFDRRLGFAIALLAVCNGVAYYGFERAFGYWPEHPQYALADRDFAHQWPFLIEILVPLAFAPLTLGLPLIAAVPFLAELFLAQDRSYPLYQAGSYYTVPFVTLCTLGAAIAIARRPAFAPWALGGALLMALFFSPTVLHFGRHPFSRDPQFDAAARWGRTAQPVDFPCADEGAWTVAAANPNARLACPGTATAGVLPPDSRPPRPAWQDVPLDSPAAWAK